MAAALKDVQLHLDRTTYLRVARDGKEVWVACRERFVGSRVVGSWERLGLGRSGGTDQSKLIVTDLDT